MVAATPLEISAKVALVVAAVCDRRAFFDFVRLAGGRRPPLQAFAEISVGVGLNGTPMVVKSIDRPLYDPFTGTQTQIRAHIPPATKTFRGANLEHEAERGQRSDAGNLLEALGGGIIGFAPPPRSRSITLICSVTWAKTVSNGCTTGKQSAGMSCNTVL